jgi:hypothetical protein
MLLARAMGPDADEGGHERRSEAVRAVVEHHVITTGEADRRALPSGRPAAELRRSSPYSDISGSLAGLPSASSRPRHAAAPQFEGFHRSSASVRGMGEVYKLQLKLRSSRGEDHGARRQTSRWRNSSPKRVRWPSSGPSYRADTRNCATRPTPVLMGKMEGFELGRRHRRSVPALGDMRRRCEAVSTRRRRATRPEAVNIMLDASCGRGP